MKFNTLTEYIEAQKNGLLNGENIYLVCQWIFHEEEGSGCIWTLSGPDSKNHEMEITTDPYDACAELFSHIGIDVHFT